MSSAGEADRSKGRLVVACIGVLLAAADTYVVVLALPSIMVGIGLDADAFQRAAPIVSGFLLGYIAMLPLIGRLSDLFGRTPVLLGSLLVFSLGSLITAGALDLPEVVAGRFLQGVGGGGLVPATLALVADMWPPDRRSVPLGIVGAVQELGSLLGPLFGAAVLSVADWRAIFWVNLAGGLVLALFFAVRQKGSSGLDSSRPDLLGLALGALATLAFGLTFVAPARLVNDVTMGLAFLPFPFWNSRFATPIGVVTLLLALGFVVRELTAPRPLLNLRNLPKVLHAADFGGASLLGLALAGIVITFAVADPQKEVLSPAGPWLLAGSAVAMVGFVWRERRTRTPLLPHSAIRAKAAWGSLLVSVLVGAALIAALVDIPVFARATVYPDSQLDAALVLVKFLIPVPIGALLGGLLARRIPFGVLTAVGLALSAGTFVAMTGWGPDTLNGRVSDLVLALCGLGFGLAIAPVNSALLGSTPNDVHGVASALLVVARMVGMLVGMSALTAIGLRRFWAAYAELPKPEELCPKSPANCPAYVDAIREAGLTQIHTVFAGAAVCAALAALIALVTLGKTTTLRSNPS